MKRHNCKYYYQIQGRLFCTERKLCLFVVYTLEDLLVIEIERNDKFNEIMLEQLVAFYQSHF